MGWAPFGSAHRGKLAHQRGLGLGLGLGLVLGLGLGLGLGHPHAAQVAEELPPEATAVGSALDQPG